MSTTETTPQTPPAPEPQAPAVIRDEIPGGFLAENGFDRLTRFDSWSEHRKALDALGYGIRDNWVPNDKHLTRWDTVNLDAAAALVSRGMTVPRIPEAHPDFPITTSVVHKAPEPRPTRALTLTAAQVGYVIALERPMRAAGFWLVCTRCAADTGTANHLRCDNTKDAPTWRIDCLCSRRRFDRTDAVPVLTPSGFLIPDAPRVLAGTDLAVRCPIKKTRCLTTDLDCYPQLDGSLLIRCQCWQIDLAAGKYRFRRAA